MVLFTTVFFVLRLVHRSGIGPHKLVPFCISKYKHWWSGIGSEQVERFLATLMGNSISYFSRRCHLWVQNPSKVHLTHLKNPGIHFYKPRLSKTKFNEALD